MQPGIYPDIPYEEYEAWPAVRASTLNACARSMAHGQASNAVKRPRTPAMAFGTALHTALLEPERYDREYVVAPKIDRRTKDGKRAWSEFEESLDGRIVIAEEEHDQLLAIAGSVYSQPVACELLSSAVARELSLVWEDEETGLLCKGRIDALLVYRDRTYILDLKSTHDASVRAFQRDVGTFGYYRSLAWYRHGLNQLAPHERGCVLLAVEKIRPYCAAAYELDDAALSVGITEMRALLRKYKAAMETDRWPGYAEDIVPLTLPRWKTDEQFASDAAA